MSITAKQRLTCQQAISKMTELEKKLVEKHKALAAELANLEASVKKCHEIECAACNMANGIIPFDKAQLAY